MARFDILLGTMQGHECSKRMSKSETVLWNPQSGQTGKVRQGQAYRVPRMESRVKVRMENRKAMDTK